MPAEPESGRDVVRAPRILVIDDDQAMLQSVGRVLRTEDFGEALLCSDPREAESLLEAHEVGVVLLDLVMPHIPGESLLGSVMASRPEIPVIVVTATDQVDTAVRCVRAGAFDYLVKPVDFSRLLAVVGRAQQQRNLRVENRRLQELIQKPDCAGPSVSLTSSPAPPPCTRSSATSRPSRPRLSRC